MNGLYPFTLTKQKTAGKFFRSLSLGNNNSFKPKKMILAVLAFLVMASTNSSLQAQPLTKTPPAIVAFPMSNVSGFVGDIPLAINLNNYFETTEEGTITYEVSVNTFPDVAHTQIDDNILTVTFDSPGQTNISIKALLQEAEAVSSFLAGAMPVIEGDHIVTDFSNLTLEPESFWNGSDQSGGFASGLAFFPNSFNPDWGAWSGWAYSNNTDNTTPGWFNQYSAITGAAVNGTTEEPGIYALTFVSGATALTYSHPSAHQTKGMFITNTTYTALSMMFGDDFSKKFGGETGDDPDWFKVTATGMRNGDETGTVEYYLADYRFEDNSKNHIIQTWQWLELSSLGKVDSIMFSLSSSDLGDWGMNTPAYFAADHLFIVPDLAPIVANPVDDITVDTNADDLVLDMSNVFTDPDDSDEKINLIVYENTNADLVQTSAIDQQLTLSFASNMSGEANITLQALSNGKTVTESFTVTVLSGTGVAFNKEKYFRVYPNPSVGQFSIEHNKAEGALLTILNTIGQMVYQSRISAAIYSLDLANLPAGTYMIRLQDEFSIQTSTLIKQ